MVNPFVPSLPDHAGLVHPAFNVHVSSLRKPAVDSERWPRFHGLTKSCVAVDDGRFKEGSVNTMLEPLGNSAFAVIGADGATNFGIVRAQDGSALLVDADIRRIDEIEEALAQTQCRRVQYLFITHENFDHSSANDYFEKKGATVIASRGCLDALREDGEAKFAEMSGRSPELFERFPGLKMGLPHVVFSDTLMVRLSGATVHLRHYEQSHSRGDATAYLEEEETFFAGDLLYTAVHPVTIYGRVESWIDSLDRLRQLSYRKIVPGHGPVGRTQDEGREHLRRFQEYMQDFLCRLSELKAGRKNAEQVIAEVYERYPGLGKRWMVKRNVDYFAKNG
jgi:glyoxylase-like metal-dependent hydrolase (beta-lactamase superfamily II)